MNCKECTKRRCPSFGSSEKCNVCLYTGGDYLEVRDWLADVAQPQAGEAFDCVEVRFKNGRKGFYRNVNRLPLSPGDIVAVESSPGHDIGCVMLTGQLARMQMRRKKEDPSSPELRKVYRLATQKDIDVWQTAISREQKTLVRTREICDNLGLVMKLSDVEYQGDNLKATFYYTAEGRVDFRQLIKELASAFGVRIEMRQIGLRQEAARVGGLMGHDVVLLERSGTLGGHMNEAVLPPFKEKTGAYFRWLVRQVEQGTAAVILDADTSPERIRAMKPDLLLIAVGSNYLVPPFPGKEHALYADQVLFDTGKAGNRVVVIGGGLVGCEVALTLAETRGCQVTIVEMLMGSRFCATTG